MLRVKSHFGYYVVGPFCHDAPTSSYSSLLTSSFKDSVFALSARSRIKSDSWLSGLLLLDDFGERTTHTFPQRVEPHVTAYARSKVRAVGFTQGAHQGIPALLANFSVLVTTPVVQPLVTVLAIFRHQLFLIAPSTPCRRFRTTISLRLRGVNACGTKSSDRGV